jgi:FkbM family methyltransferase
VKGPIWATLRDGTRIRVSPNDYHGRILYLFGTNDPKVAHVTRWLLRGGDCFLDIGANYSSIGLAASHVVGPEGRVHLFEPQRELGDRVEEAIRQGGYGIVTVHRIGLWDRDDELQLTQPVNHSGMATFVPREKTDKWRVTDSCPVRDVATYLPPLVEGRRFGVKLDVEGAETRILPWLMRQAGLRFVVCEAAHNQGDLLEMLAGRGFVLYGLVRHPVLYRMERIRDLGDLDAFHDCVTVRIPAGVEAPERTSPKSLGKMLDRAGA